MRCVLDVRGTTPPPSRPKPTERLRGSARGFAATNRPAGPPECGIYVTELERPRVPEPGRRWRRRHRRVVRGRSTRRHRGRRRCRHLRQCASSCASRVASARPPSPSRAHGPRGVATTRTEHVTRTSSGSRCASLPRQLAALTSKCRHQDVGALNSPGASRGRFSAGDDVAIGLATSAGASLPVPPSARAMTQAAFQESRLRASESNVGAMPTWCRHQASAARPSFSSGPRVQAIQARLRRVASEVSPPPKQVRCHRTRQARDACPVSPPGARVRPHPCGLRHGKSVSSGRSTSNLCSPRVARRSASARRLAPYQLGAGRGAARRRVSSWRSDTKRRAGAGGEPPLPNSRATTLHHGGLGPVSSVLPSSAPPLAANGVVRADIARGPLERMT
jgi:hypothetical protein